MPSAIERRVLKREECFSPSAEDFADVSESDSPSPGWDCALTRGPTAGRTGIFVGACTVRCGSAMPPDSIIDSTDGPTARYVGIDPVTEDMGRNGVATDAEPTAAMPPGGCKGFG